jgi:hypothetical protein
MLVIGVGYAHAGAETKKKRKSSCTASSSSEKTPVKQQQILESQREVVTVASALR